MLKQQLQNNQTKVDDNLIDPPDALCAKCGGKKTGYWSGFRGFDDEDTGEEGSHNLAAALRKDFDEKEVRKAVRGLGRDPRSRLYVLPLFLKAFSLA